MLFFASLNIDFFFSTAIFFVHIGSMWPMQDHDK